jgi:ribosomal protein L11 methyltransferase
MTAYTRIFIPLQDEEAQQILAAYLAAGDFDAFENLSDGLVAFIPTTQFDNLFLKTALENFGIIESDCVFENIAPQNWNAVWESNFEPIYVNKVCAVRAPFHAPMEVEIDIIIEPKMSFGTGHHATTFMMMEYMTEHDFVQRKVLDFGSGTGILAILASKLGATNVMAIDNEDWAVENCRENCERNGVNNIATVLGEKEKVTGMFDVVLANINRHIILASFDVIKQCLLPSGDIFISGILNQDEIEMQTLFDENGFRFINKKQKDNWSALHFIKK